MVSFGDLIVEDIDNSVDLRCNQANMDIQNIAGNAIIDVRYSNYCNIRNMRKDLTANVEYSGVYARQLYGNVNINGSFSNITISELYNSTNIRNNYGAIYLEPLYPEEGYKIFAKTRYSNIKGEPYLTTKDNDKNIIRTAVGTIGEGKYVLNFQTEAGDIIIRE